MRGNIFPFALSPFNFNGLGGVEIEGPVSFTLQRVGLSISLLWPLYVALYPRRQRFWYACQRVESSSAREILFFALPLCFFRACVRDGKGCRYFFTISGGALGFYAGGSEGSSA